MKVQKPKKLSSNARDVRKDLRAIYQRKDGSMPDMHHFSQKNKKHGFRRFLIRAILFLLIASVLAWSGFFFFSKGLFTKNDSFVASIESVEKIKAGDPVVIKIHYENVGDVPFAALELTASFPPDFHLTSAVPEANEKNTWKIGSLTPKSDGVITLNGIFLAEVPSTEKLQVVFTYKPANFNSSFQHIETKELQVDDSVLEMNIKGPETAAQGDVITYVYTVGQTQKEPVQDMRVIPLIPDTFHVTEIDPPFVDGERYWNQESLQPNQPKSFSLKGSFTSSADGEQKMGGHVGFISENTYLKQREVDQITTIQAGAIAFHLIINGSNTDVSVDPTQSLRGSVDYQNTSKESITDSVFTLSFDGTGALPLDWENADLKSGKQSGNTIVWDASSKEALKNLAPGTSGIFDFTIPLIIGSKTTDHFLATLSVRSKTKSAGTHLANTSPLTITLNAQTTFRSEARYFNIEGIPIGSGALPPSVGETTTYRIYWNISNSTHDLSNISVTATLPANVTWVDKSATDIGDISFKSATRTVTWQTSKLPISIPRAGAWFDVSITPKSTDVGDTLNLTGATIFQAKDVVTSKAMEKTTEALTTLIPLDEFASGKGKVTK